tara:strand:- start:933 stop:1352 length:420 start_codon:yes stop_codon:yes gene_type:complete
MSTVYQQSFKVNTNGFTDILDITEQVTAILQDSKKQDGIINVFVVGSTAGITTIEFEEGAVLDLKNAFERIAPMDANYSHNERWGDGNGFSHIRASILGPSLSIPFKNETIELGTWQQIVLVDFDNRKRERNIIVTIHT